MECMHSHFECQNFVTFRQLLSIVSLVVELLFIVAVVAIQFSVVPVHLPNPLSVADLVQFGESQSHQKTRLFEPTG